MGKLTPKGHYPNAAEKDVKYGSIIVVSSVASTYGGESGYRIFIHWIPYFKPILACLYIMSSYVESRASKHHPFSRQRITFVNLSTSLRGRTTNGVR